MDKELIEKRIENQIFNLKQELKNKENILISYKLDKISQYKNFYVEDLNDTWRFSTNENFDKCNWSVPKNKYKTIEKAFLRVVACLITDIERKNNVYQEVLLF